jgi:hypothetical protein
MDTNPVQRRQLSAVWQLILLPLSALSCMFMLVWTLIGLGCVVLGLSSLLVDLSGELEMRLGGELVRTTGEQMLFTAVGAGMAATGIGFWWLWRRAYTGRALLVCALLLGLLLIAVWVSGRGDLVSVGGATH